tara:strand:- start:148 stop:441 length:294 start_codon:yes stop_codon:yes gene_type:complete
VKGILTCFRRRQAIEAKMFAIHEANPKKALLVVHSRFEAVTGGDHDLLCAHVDNLHGVVVGGNLVGYLWGNVLNEKLRRRREADCLPQQAAASSELV